MSFNKNIIKLAGVITVAALILVARFYLIDPPTATTLITKYGYWAVALTFVGFAVLLARQLPGREELLKLGKAHRAGLLCALLAGIYFQVDEPREFKVLFDEFVISGVARNMHFDREATYPGRAHYFDGHLIIMESGVDKRPFFFPFIISLVHDATGYRPENVFYLNACLAVILLLLVYAVGVAFGGTRLGCLGLLVLAGLPLIAQNATDGGYELANLVMILLLYFVGSRYYRSSGAQGLDLFILTAVLLAQIRYESILYVLIVPAVVLCKWCQEKRITLTWMAAFSPGLLLMPLLANENFSAHTAYFQTNPGEAFLSPHNFSENARVAIFYLFNPSFDGTNSFLLSVSGLFGVAFFLLLTGQKIKQWFVQRDEGIVLLFLFVLTCINTGMILCLAWGRWDDPMVSRFSLPLQLLMLVLMLRSTVEFLKSGPLPKWMVIFAGIWIVLFAAPASARHFQTNHSITAREYAWLFDYLAKKDPATTLTISGSAIGPILYNMPCIPIGSARNYRWQIKTCLDEGIYREMVVIQRFQLDFKTGKYVERGPTVLGDGFKLETIGEKIFYPDIITRLSRVVDVDLDHTPKPTSLEKKTTFLSEQDYDAYLLNKFP
ncbi:MAG TPA: hypothetical protein VNV15_02390 [Opitutaceae bacterium]|jgi:hypothetical protein|nr:hypothetical protein [Opitutaceae bacterium]